MTVSEDDGFSWSTPRDISENATRMSWKWVGTGVVDLRNCKYFNELVCDILDDIGDLTIVGRQM